MKALIGSWDNRPYRLLAEITALRARVAQLEQELSRAHHDNALLQEALRERDEVVLTGS
ncbi:MAG TPA: hypothetical protein VM324_07945 [Egibacteraceae bacterium]|jgi:hypothetical protein|nr:hypothetical protein [Egibacteraceae bacterium]